jgi:hypothetical protein
MPLPYYPDWTKATGDAAVQLTAITGAPGNLWPYPLGALPGGIEKGMPKLEEAYISGYVLPQYLLDGIQAIGELMVTRGHDVPISGKAYLYLVGIDSGANPYFRGPYKPYPEHYYNKDAGIPVNDLFGRINPAKLGQTNV